MTLRPEATSTMAAWSQGGSQSTEVTWTTAQPLSVMSGVDQVSDSFDGEPLVEVGPICVEEEVVLAVEELVPGKSQTVPRKA